MSVHFVGRSPSLRVLLSSPPSVHFLLWIGGIDSEGEGKGRIGRARFHFVSSGALLSLFCLPIYCIVSQRYGLFSIYIPDSPLEALFLGGCHG